MKILLIIIMSVILTKADFAQNPEQVKMHLFLGEWEILKGGTTIHEKWDVKSDSELTGSAYEITGSDTVLTEKLSLRYIDVKLCYCATPLGLNETKEIIFHLKSVENYGRKYIFENPSHDYPQRIIYSFETFTILNAFIEGDIGNEFKQIEFPFKRKIDVMNSYQLTATIRKENFVNKINKVIEGVYDYFLEIEGTKYFIKINKSAVSLDEMKKYIDKPVKIRYSMQEGLWDTDDPNVQSRIGVYVAIINISE